MQQLIESSLLAAGVDKTVESVIEREGVEGRTQKKHLCRRIKRQPLLRDRMISAAVIGRNICGSGMNAVDQHLRQLPAHRVDDRQQLRLRPHPEQPVEVEQPFPCRFHLQLRHRNHRQVEGRPHILLRIDAADDRHPAPPDAGAVHIRPGAMPPDQHSVAHQLADRPVQRRPRHPELPHQLKARRQRRIRRIDSLPHPPRQFPRNLPKRLLAHPAFPFQNYVTLLYYN